MARIDVANVDNEKKLKAMFVLKCKGSDLSTEIKEMVDKYAKEFDNMKGE